MKKQLCLLLAGLFVMMASEVSAKDITFLPSEFTAVESADYSLTKDGVTMTVTSSTVNDSQFRIFKSQTITLTSNNALLTKIVLTCTANGTAKYGPGNFAATDGYTFEAEGKTGTWVGNAPSLTLTAETAQVRATEIVVTVGNETMEDYIENDGIYYHFITKAKLAEVVANSNNNNVSSVIIPETVEFEGFPFSVVSIKEGAFQGCSSLTSISISNSVTSIGSRAFYGCNNLTNISIPNSVSSISSSLFEGCSSLTSISIPNSITSIGDNAFHGCSSLTNISLPNSVTSIGNGAFKDCSGLTSIDISGSVTNIGSSAFQGCNSLTNISIPNSVTSISSSLFEGCSNLTSFSIPNSITSIGDNAFHGCSCLTDISIPNSVTNIGSGAFYGCSGLTNISIPNSVTSISSSLFEGCSNLTSFSIPNSITSIGDNAFHGCSSLTNISLHNSVTSIGRYAFESCSGLTSIKIPDSVLNIGSGAFKDCNSLTNISIPNSVNSIGGNAFADCSALISVTFHCKQIGNWFNSNTNIKNVTIGDEVTTIGDAAFYGFAGLTSVTIPNSVTSIGNNAFYGCRSLTDISIPNSVSTIGGSSFYGCTHLTSIIIGNSVKNVGSTSFANCPGITDVFCYAKKIPNVALDVFKESYAEYATLHIPTTLLDYYKEANPWKTFNVVAIDHIKGDANSDNIVDVVDISHIINHIKGQTLNGFNAMAADINNDGKVDAADIKNQIDVLLKPGPDDVVFPLTGSISVAEAIAAINALADGAYSENSYTVKGYIVGTPEFQRNPEGTLYGNVNFEIADEKGGTVTLTVFRAKNFENANFDEETISSLKEGDLVEIQGLLQKYVKEDVTIPELANGYLISNSGGQP